jgi:hypothetical protein
MNRFGSVSIALALVASLMGPNPSSAAGALAVGTTGNIARDGIAVNSIVDAPSEKSAGDQVLDACRKNTSVPPAGRAACQIVQTFTRKCIAIVYDPKPGTPGEGWAIEPDKKTAETHAMANCQATAGLDRRAFCEIARSVCDTHD